MGSRPAQESLRLFHYVLKEVFFGTPSSSLEINGLQTTGRVEMVNYTDGSKLSLGTGVFYEEIHLEKIVIIANSCTVFQAAQFSFLQGQDDANCLCREQIKRREILSYEDSQTDIKDVDNYIVSSKLVKELPHVVVR